MTDPSLSLAVIPLMKGVVYRDGNEATWQQVRQLQAQVRDYVDVLGLQVVIDEAEGYAYLRQRPAEDDEAGQLPRLVPRRTLSFHVRTNSTRSTRTYCRSGTSSARPEPCAAPWNGWVSSRSSMTPPPTDTWTATPGPTCPDPPLL